MNKIISKIINKFKGLLRSIIDLLIKPFNYIKIGRRLMIFTIFIIITIVLTSSIIFINIYQSRVLEDEQQKLNDTLGLVNSTILDKKEEYKRYAASISAIPEVHNILSKNGNDTILYDLMGNLGFSGLELKDDEFKTVTTIGMETGIEKDISKNLLELMDQGIPVGIFETNENYLQIYGISPIKNKYGIGAMGAVIVSQNIGSGILQMLSENINSDVQLYRGNELSSNTYNTFEDINLLDDNVINYFHDDSLPEYLIETKVVNDINYMIGYIPLRGFSNQILGYITVVSSLQSAYNTINQMIIQTAIFSSIFILIASILVYIITKSITIPLNEIILATQNIAKGDLTKKLVIKSNDEFTDLAKHFNVMINNLRNIIFEISDSSISILNMSENLSANSEEVSAASQEVASASQEIASGTEEQASQTDKTIRILEEIKNISNQVNDISSEVNEAVDIAYQNSNYGLEVMSGVSDSMSNILIEVNNSKEEVNILGDKIEEIDNIIEAINYINEETSLLSLNATIEAARAGENGRGFAVVASEIRDLADKTSESVSEISAVFQEISVAKSKVVKAMTKSNQLVNKGEEAVDKAEYVFGDIRDAIDNSKKEVNRINTFIAEQLEGTRNIEESVNQINEIATSNADEARQSAKVNQEQANIIEDIATAADDLSSMAYELEKVVKQFNISRD